MSFDLTSEQRAFRDVMHSFVDERIAPNAARYDREQIYPQDSFDACVEMELPSLGVPEAYGGAGADMVTQAIMAEELARGCASTSVTLLISKLGMLPIMNFASEEIKHQYLPRIASGEIQASYCLSEADAGSDVASMRCRAVRDGDDYVINGQKMWTSLIAYADWVWLAVRTNPEAKKHRGISMLAVPTTAEGFSWTPVHTMAGVDTSATYYSDVRVPVTNLIGEENGGWKLVTNQLNHERVTLCSPGIIDRSLADVRAWAQSTKLPDGRRVIDQQWVQEHLARVRAELEYLRLINWKVAWQATQGRLDVADASSIKVFGTEFYLRAFRLLMEVIGQAAYLQRDSPGAVLAGRLEMYARSMIILTFGGGTNEIQRDLIAIFGLGMPRSLR